ncbi:MAG: FliG C-terminal domain-containing protein [bacterium]
MRKLIIVLWICVFVAGFFDYVFSEINEASIETRIALETSLETRLKNIISEIVGSDKVIVVVNALLYAEKQEKSLKNIVKKKTKEAAIILPGVPVENKLDNSKDDIPLLAPLTFQETRTSIKRINSTILLDKSVSAATVPVVAQVAGSMLGLDPDRGDTLEVKRISFGKAMFDWKSLLKTPDIYIVSAIALGVLVFFFGAVFSFGPLRKFFSNLIAYMKARNEKESGEGATLRQESSASRAAVGGVSFGGGASPSGGGLFGGTTGGKPFSFINESHINDLIYLAKQATPEEIATIINYLNPAFTARVMVTLEEDVQEKVTEHLAAVKEYSKEDIKTLEDKIKSKLDYLVGGEERLTAMMGFFDRELQTKMLNQLNESHSDMASRIRKTIFNFENLVNLEPKIVQMIIRNINPGVFAQVLKSTHGNFQEKLLSMLPEGQSERLKQEMLLAKPLSKKRIEDEKRVIVNLVKSFEQQGIIELNK